MKMKVMAAAIGLAFLSMGANAAFTIDKKPAEPAAPAVESSKAKSSFQSGAFKGDVVNGFGRDVSLNDAAHQIIPAGWNLSVSPEIEERMNGHVSWQGGRPWVDVLNDVVRDTGIAVIVTPDTNNVLLQSARVVEAAANGYTFQLFTEDRNLRTGFKRWAKRSGYQFIWDAGRDVPCDFNYSTKKSLKAALDEVITSVNELSDVQIAADFYETEGQKVLRISKLIKEAAK